jgi:hypothetical protein
VAALVGVGKATPDAQPAAEAAETRELVRDLVGRLGTKNAKVQEAVSAALVALGKDAVPGLKEALKSDKQDVVMAAQKLIEKIEKPGAAAARPQGRGGPFDGDALAKELGLDEKQKSAMDDLLARQREAWGELRNLDRGDRRQRMQEMQKELRDGAKKVLNEEQFKKFEESMRDAIPGGGRPGKGKGR